MARVLGVGRRVVCWVMLLGRRERLRGSRRRGRLRLTCLFRRAGKRGVWFWIEFEERNRI